MLQAAASLQREIPPGDPWCCLCLWATPDWNLQRSVPGNIMPWCHGPKIGVWGMVVLPSLGISYNACINPYHIAGMSWRMTYGLPSPFLGLTILWPWHMLRSFWKMSTSNKARIFMDFHSTPTHLHLPNFGIACPSAHSPPPWAPLGPPWAPWAPAPFSWPSSWRSGAVLGRLTC